MLESSQKVTERSRIMVTIQHSMILNTFRRQSTKTILDNNYILCIKFQYAHFLKFWCYNPNPSLPGHCIPFVHHPLTLSCLKYFHDCNAMIFVNSLLLLIIWNKPFTTEYWLKLCRVPSVIESTGYVNHYICPLHQPNITYSTHDPKNLTDTPFFDWFCHNTGRWNVHKEFTANEPIFYNLLPELLGIIIQQYAKMQFNPSTPRSDNQFSPMATTYFLLN